MLLSGMVWTYILSTAAGIAATLNPNKVLFHNTMDQLNYFMRERSLPAPMRRQLRDFFEHARHAQGHASSSAYAAREASASIRWPRLARSLSRPAFLALDLVIAPSLLQAHSVR